MSCDSEVQSGLSSYTGYVQPADPYIVIDAVKYTYYDCIHTETYGVVNMCEGKTDCSFEASNANIGSSCGTDTDIGDHKGLAGLFITWHCVRKYQ